MTEATALIDDATFLDQVRALADGSDDDTSVTAQCMAALQRHRPAWGWVGIYLLVGDTLYLGPYVGPPTDHVRIPVGVGVCGTAVAEERNQRIDDVRALDNYLACSLTTRSELVVLVHDQGDIIGQIDIDSDAVGTFTDADEALLTDVANLLLPRLRRLRDAQAATVSE